jgi:L-asparaginase
MQIKLLLTGGTIDAKYNELTAEIEYSSGTHIDAMLTQARTRLDIEIDQLMLVNSLDISEEMRQQIMQAAANAGQDKVVITHGTDTIVETAQLLGKNPPAGKTIVLVGAMVPFAFGSSDALFNLGSALAAVQTMPAGVYITMNGKIFDWDNVIKNRELGEFQER